MINILTAIGNEKINNQLNKINNINIVFKDIQYKEGILEILELYKDIDILIISDNIDGQISFNELFEKINILVKKIKIIFIIEKRNEKNINELKKEAIYKIIQSKDSDLENLIKIINDCSEEQINNIKIIENKDIYRNINKDINKDINEDIKEELNKIKEMIINNQMKVQSEKNVINKANEKNKINKKTKLKNIINKIKININNKINIKNINKLNSKNIENNRINISNKNKCKVIYITGCHGIGKSIFTVNLSKSEMFFKRKILIIELNIKNNYINKIMRKYKNNISNNEGKIKINKYIDILPFYYLLDNLDNKEEIQKLIKQLNTFIIKNRKNYDYILIDSNDTYSFKEIIYKIDIINNCNIIIFLSGSNLLEINKSVILLDKYINKLKIDTKKFNIIFNKYDNYSIKKELLNNIFNEFNILGILRYDSKYNNMINKNDIYFKTNKKIRMEYLNINKKIEKIINN